MKQDPKMTKEYKIKLTDLPREERPRERLIQHGSAALSNSELLAILLRTGSQKENVLNLSARILKDYNLKELSTAGITDLKDIAGVKDAKACQIAACFELARRLESFTDGARPQIKQPRDVYTLLAPKFRNLKKEHFKCLYLNTKNYVLKEETISIGSLSANIVHPREVLKSAIRESAAAIILAHNHPSGDPAPSKDDIALTERLQKAGELVGIDVLDHVIVGDGEYISMIDEGVVEVKRVKDETSSSGRNVAFITKS